MKAVLIWNEIDFPFTHTVERLAKLLPDPMPDHLLEIGNLTPFAVEEMYPDTFTDLSVDHATEAIALATAAIDWASSIIQPTR